MTVSHRPRCALEPFGRSSQLNLLILMYLEHDHGHCLRRRVSAGPRFVARHTERGRRTWIGRCKSE